MKKELKPRWEDIHRSHWEGESVALDEKDSAIEPLRYNVQYNLLDRVNELYEKVVKDVMRKLLQREPTNKDAANITLASTENEPNKQLMSYCGTKLGWISIDYPDGDKHATVLSVRFDPI